MAQAVRKLTVLVHPGPTDSTTNVLARYAFLEATKDPEFLSISIVQVQKTSDLDAAECLVQYMEAVLTTISVPCGRWCEMRESHC